MLTEITKQFYALMAEASRQAREGAADKPQLLRTLFALEDAIQSDSGAALRRRDLFTFAGLQALLPRLHATQRLVTLAP